MPRYMQEVILAELEHSDRGPLITKTRTPDPFPSLNVATKDMRYSTLSLGRFEEVHVQKRYEAYGRATLDDLVGNLAMEQFVRHLEQGGHPTGLDLAQLDRSVAEAGWVFPA